MTERKQFGRAESERDSLHNTRTHHPPGEAMKPWMQRILIGLVVALASTGMINAWNMVAENARSSTRIEQAVNDISTDFDRFTDIRYQADMEQLGRRMAQYEARLDRISATGNGSGR